MAADFFGFGCAVASGVSLGVEDAFFVEDFLAFDFAAAGVSLGVDVASDSSVLDFLAFAFFFGDGEGDAPFFFFAGDALDFAVGLGDSSVEFTG